MHGRRRRQRARLAQQGLDAHDAQAGRRVAVPQALPAAGCAAGVSITRRSALASGRPKPIATTRRSAWNSALRPTTLAIVLRHQQPGEEHPRHARAARAATSRPSAVRLAESRTKRVGGRGGDVLQEEADAGEHHHRQAEPLAER